MLDLSKNHLLLGNCLDRMKEISDNTVDAIVTDPPYGYAFMNKQWDIDVPSIEIWKECLRILKPGAFAFVMSAPRSDVFCKMCINIQSAGFDISFTPIYWAYASGFPKAINIAKAIDRRIFEDWIKNHPELYEKREKLRKDALKDQPQVECDMGHFTSTEESGDMLPSSHNSTEKGKILRSFELELKQMWAKELGETYDETPLANPHRLARSYTSDPNVFAEAQGKERTHIDHPKTDPKQTSIFQQVNREDKRVKIGKQKFLPLPKLISKEAKIVAGMYGGFQPKPAVECIVVAMKPCAEDTFIDQAIANGKGGTNLDRGRIPGEFTELLKNGAKGFCGNGGSGVYGWNSGDPMSCKDSIKPPLSKKERDKIVKKMVGGRLSYGISFGDSKVEGYKIRLPKHRGGPIHYDPTNEHPNQGWNNPDGEYCGEGSAFDIDLRGRFPANLVVAEEALGDFSKYFDLDEWYWVQMKNLPPDQQATFPFLTVPKPTKAEKNKGLENFKEQKVNDGRETPIDNAYQRGESMRKNIHPTVKALKLFTYLIAISPTKIGDIIVDPFVGSGTCCIAAHQTNRKYIGIELTPEYYNIAKGRLQNAAKQKSLITFGENENGQ